jgi:hypothetical protein
MTPDDLKARIAARRAEAVERRATAEAAGGVTWNDVENDAGAVLIHIAANDPATVVRDQDRIIAGCDADLALLDWLDGFTPGFGHMPAISNSSQATREQVGKALVARYGDTDGGAV